MNRFERIIISDESNSETPSKASNSDASNQANKKIKKWTCRMCKKQFTQRNELNKHECVESKLKLYKKKEDMRKKKWKEAHWKRRIDLSYIETTSLVQLSQNIADNLSFCIDGTYQDIYGYWFCFWFLIL